MSAFMAVLVPAGGAHNAHAGDMTLDLHTLAPYLLNTHEVTMHNYPLHMSAPPLSPDPPTPFYDTLPSQPFLR